MPYQNFVIEPLLKLPLSRMAPLALTLFACLFGLLIPAFLYYHCSTWALICLLLSGFCDTLDGSLARHQGRVSVKGAALDITSDRMVECTIILGLYLYDPTRALGAILMLGSSLLCVTSFLVVGIFEKTASEKSFFYSPGLIERAEAFIFFAAMIISPQSFKVFAALYSCLVFFTALLRLYQFCRML